MARKLILLAPLAIVGMVLFIALGGFIVQLLWNSLLPPLFGLPAVTFWQALGLLVLCRILFGGFRMHSSGRPGIRGRMALRRRLFERWERMSPEERERFRQGMRGHGAPESPSPGEPGV